VGGGRVPHRANARAVGVSSRAVTGWVCVKGARLDLSHCGSRSASVLRWWGAVWLLAILAVCDPFALGSPLSFGSGHSVY
jgi:hypothetical protein